MSGDKLLIGADPEVFVVNPEGKFISAHAMCKGTKEKPEPVKNGAVQVDGTALEFNIDPADNPEDFAFRISSVMDILKGYIPEGCTIAATPVAKFGHEYLATLPESATELGCNPDFNAWTSLENPRPDAKMDFRTGSGHVHIGWNHLLGVGSFDPTSPEHKETCELFVKELDYALGVPSLLYDKDKIRRKLYGKAGAYRPKPYGMEYRVLSNRWLRDPQLMAWVFNNVKQAYDNLVGGNRSCFRQNGNWAQGTIDSSSAYLDSIRHVCGQGGYALPPTVLWEK